jgi:membrane protein
MATIIGVVLLLIGATTVFGELQDALDRIWRVPVRNHALSGWLSLVRARVLSFGMVLAIGFLLTVSLVASTAVEALGQRWNLMLGGWYPMALATNSVIAFGLSAVMFALIYKVMPRARVWWSDVWIGAVFTALLFTIGKWLISLYIGRSGITSAFGAAGSLVVVLLWVYYSAQIFLIGAEFTWVYAHVHGSRNGSVRQRTALAGSTV